MARKTKEQQKKERQSKVEHINKINSVETIMEWKNDRESLSVEEYNADMIEKLGWKETDVLYSFLSIYAIGMLVFYPERYRRTTSQIRDRLTSKNVYSKEFITNEYSKCKELNIFLKEKGFICNYFKIGNVIPIWPGGNTHKGKSSVFDLPEVYFNKKGILRWSELITEVYPNAYLEEVLNTDWVCDKKVENIKNPPIFIFSSMCEFFDSLVGKDDEFNSEKRKLNYEIFLDRILGIIRNRNQELLSNYGE